MCDRVRVPQSSPCSTGPSLVRSHGHGGECPRRRRGWAPPGAGRVRPARRPGMLRAHDDLRSHRGDRERPPARRRRPAAPHRPPLPGQARRRRRRPRATYERVRRRGQPGRARAHRRAGCAKGDRLALLSHNCWQFAVVAFATAKLGVVLVPVNFMLERRRDRVHPAPLRRAGDRRRGRAGARPRRRRWPTPGSPAASAAGSAVRRGARAGWEDVDGWWRDGPDGGPGRAGRPTTTRCG